MTRYKGNGFIHDKCINGTKAKTPLYTAKIFFKDSTGKTTYQIIGSWCRVCKKLVPKEHALDRGMI